MNMTENANITDPIICDRPLVLFPPMPCLVKDPLLIGISYSIIAIWAKKNQILKKKLRNRFESIYISTNKEAERPDKF